MANSNVKVYYFNAKGRAEIVRLVLAAAGKKYEDIRFKDRDEWVKTYKPNSPFGQSPYVEIDGKKYSQSIAIANYFAREFKMFGSSSLDALRIEEVEGLVGDLISLWIKAQFGTQDEAEKAKLNKTLQEEDFPRFMGYFESLLKQSGTGFFVGSSLTPADLCVYEITDGVATKSPAVLQKFPELARNRQNVVANKGIADYLKTRPQTEF